MHSPKVKWIGFCYSSRLVKKRRNPDVPAYSPPEAIRAAYRTVIVAPRRVTHQERRTTSSSLQILFSSLVNKKNRSEWTCKPNSVLRAGQARAERQSFLLVSAHAKTRATYPGVFRGTALVKCSCLFQETGNLPPFQASSSIWSCAGWGLPSSRRHHRDWCALTAPFHPYRSGDKVRIMETQPAAERAAFPLLLFSPERRYLFCGTFRSLAAPSR
jgi:hypothetical protein